MPTEAAGQDTEGGEESAKQLPEWMPWDRAAVAEQKQALAQLQVLLLRPLTTSITSLGWDRPVTAHARIHRLASHLGGLPEADDHLSQHRNRRSHPHSETYAI